MKATERLPARQGRLLFAYLVLSRGTAVRRDELFDALWPKRPPRDPDAALASVLARLRGVVGTERLPPRGPVQLRLGDRAWVDVEAAQHGVAGARAALDCGRSDEALQTACAALAIVEQPLLAEFEGAWLEERRCQLKELIGPLVEVAVDAGLRCGGGALARAELIARRGVEREPFRETSHAALMRVLASRGDNAEALRVFDELRVRLRDELGVSPSRALLELHQQLLTGEPVASQEEVTEPESPVRARVPIPPFPLLGRERELERLRRLMDEANGRLVTVVGPGGVGKTRMVTELARERMGDRPTVWVALAAVSTHGGVALAIAHALSSAGRTVEPTSEALTQALGGRERLLVLDNFEHVLAAARLVADLLAGASRLAVLITSREPLHLRAEHVFALGPLALGAPGEVARSPAVALFLATARARRPDLEFTPADMEAVTGICRRVDGLPLAIELAAGRLGVLSPRELGAQVRAGLDALGEGPRDAPERQRTLRDTLAWSHRLLSVPEQEAFARFAVFAGGATAPAARAVTGAELTTLEALTAKHLVTVAGDGDGVRRLDMLETIRQFARERLAQRPDAEAIGRRHAEHYLELAEGAAPELRRHGSRRLFRSLDREVHNLRAAMTWALAHDEPEVCVRIAVALEEYWPQESPVDAARWLKAGMEAAGERLPAPLLARALVTLADQLSVTATIAEAEVVARRAVDVARATNDPETTAEALMGLAWTLLMRFRETEAYPFAQEALTLARATGDPELAADAWSVLATCSPDIEAAREAAAPAIRHFEAADNANRLLDLYDGLAYLALALHDDDAARKFHERAKAAAKHAPVAREIAWVHHNEGLLELMSGNLADARAAFARQVTVAYRQAIDELLPEGLYGLAVVIAGEGDDEHAARLYGLAEQLLGSEGVHPAIRERLEPLYVDPARRRLGVIRWEIEGATGRGLDAAAGIALAGIDVLADGQIERVTS